MKHYLKDVEFKFKLKLNKTAKEVFYDWYIKERLSSIEISEKLFEICNFTITSRTIRRWLTKFKLIRTHSDSMRNRVVMGRMDYGKRKNDYSTQKIDYKNRPLRGKKRKLHIEVDHETINTVRGIAKESLKTISEVVRDAIEITSHDPKQINKTLVDRLKYALKYKKEKLLTEKVSKNQTTQVCLRLLQSQSRN